MKSTLFKSAWAIYRMQNVTFSEALRLAWKSVKQGIRAVVVRMNKLVKSVGLGYETVYFNQLTFVNIVTPVSYDSWTVSNGAGAGAWYDGKTYNGD